jgi:hypothetical protein
MSHQGFRHEAEHTIAGEQDWSLGLYFSGAAAGSLLMLRCRLLIQSWVGVRGRLSLFGAYVFSLFFIAVIKHILFHKTSNQE